MALATGLALACAAACAADEPGPAAIRAVDARPHVVALADDAFEGREAGTRGGQAAAAYIAEAIAPLGLLPAGDGGSFFQRFQGMRNVVALLPGSDPTVADEAVVVGAHYDHVGYGSGATTAGHVHNGADDNASGAAGVIEIAEALAALPRAPRRSVVVAWWDGEEKGLLGSSHFVRAGTGRLAGLRTVFTLNLDMIGRLRGGRVEVYGSRSGEGLRRALVRANAAVGLDLVFDWDLVDDSDHHPFILAGVPSLFLHTGLHREYHHPDDDAHLVDPEGVAQVSRLALGMLLAVADGAEAAPAYRPRCRHESERSRRELESAGAARIASPPRGAYRPWGIATRSDPAEPMTPVVIAVAEQSPMAAAGIRPADRLVEIGGRAPASHDEALPQLRGAGQEIELVIERGGRLVEVVVRR